MYLYIILLNLLRIFIISDINFYLFKRTLNYKDNYNNKKLLKVDRFYPSSKLCYRCGSIKKDLSLKDRIYIRNNYNLNIDRDYNASLNLHSQLKQELILIEFTLTVLMAL